MVRMKATSLRTNEVILFESITAISDLFDISTYKIKNTYVMTEEKPDLISIGNFEWRFEPITEQEWEEGYTIFQGVRTPFFNDEDRWIMNIVDLAITALSMRAREAYKYGYDKKMSCDRVYEVIIATFDELHYPVEFNDNLYDYIDMHFIRKLGYECRLAFTSKTEERLRKEREEKERLWWEEHGYTMEEYERILWETFDQEFDEDLWLGWKEEYEESLKDAYYDEALDMNVEEWDFNSEQLFV